MSESARSSAQSATESQAENAEKEGHTESISGWDKDQSIAHEQQMVFGNDGDLEPDGDSVEVTLGAYGAEVDNNEEETQFVEPAASEFGVDDRQQASQRNKTTSKSKTENDQQSLFADVEDDQQTLAGENASTRCLFEKGD